MNIFFIGKNGQKNANKRTLLELIKNQIEGKISKRIIYSLNGIMGTISCYYCFLWVE